LAIFCHSSIFQISKKLQKITLKINFYRFEQPWEVTTQFLSNLLCYFVETIIDCQLNIILENCLKTQPFGLDEQMYLA